MEARSKETSAVHRGGAPVETKLLRIAEKARKEPAFKFTSLFHSGRGGAGLLFSSVGFMYHPLRPLVPSLFLPTASVFRPGLHTGRHRK